MRRWLLVVALVLPLAGCLVETGYVRTPPPGCRDAHWVDAHYDSYGSWVPAHWRCRI